MSSLNENPYRSPEEPAEEVLRRPEWFKEEYRAGLRWTARGMDVLMLFAVLLIPLYAAWWMEASWRVTLTLALAETALLALAAAWCMRCSREIVDGADVLAWVPVGLWALGVWWLSYESEYVYEWRWSAGYLSLWIGALMWMAYARQVAKAVGTKREMLLLSGCNSILGLGIGFAVSQLVARWIGMSAYLTTPGKAYAQYWWLAALHGATALPFVLLWLAALYRLRIQIRRVLASREE